MSNKVSSDSRLKMVLSDVMTSTIHAISPDDTVANAANMMLENRVGSIIIREHEEKNNPIGIITERDIVTGVVAVGKDPKKTSVDEIATKPVITAPPTLAITKAMALMARMNIRRLIVVEENLCVGIVTYRDLLRVAPSLLEIALEYEKIGFGNTVEDEILDFTVEDYDADSETENPDLTVGFYCNQCGEWCDGSPLYDTDDQPICSDCLDE